ncbi:energy-coupling factor transporter transmembrane component T [Niameybacter massiliensis]|uniref:Energy-coupling factor transporter transmembrane component T n=1 Tax=Holtiella tumoricola TaxID=3018743 RepID=A0AA42J266_9FIRM|nr:energy-coupling factor transporter transmembrane component T [Holtiella tumoricola]MDA3733262.1 energy-coupling factor transporter transmembrane component T [Holtiella tumoricola]
MAKLAESIVDKVSIDYLRNQVYKNAYGNDDTPIALLDPRTLLVWYLFFGVVPWFIDNVYMLLGLFLFVAVTTKLAKIAPLVLFLFCVGIFTQSGYLLFVSLFFGGNMSTVVPLLVLTLKVAVVSLASITVFSGLDPDKLSNGLLYFGCPDQLSFSISFAYRILPILMEQFQNILLSCRLRGMSPDKTGFKGKVKYLIYQVKIIILAFYPLMLNTAKCSRTTVEALEVKGYRYATSNPRVKKMKLSVLKFTQRDVAFAGISIFYVISITFIAMGIGA